MIGGKEEWAGLLIPLPGAGITFGGAGSGPLEDEFLESVVFANIELPGVARGVGDDWATVTDEGTHDMPISKKPARRVVVKYPPQGGLSDALQR